MNTAASAAAVLSSAAFGYIATYFGSYNAPFFPMVATLCLGALLWLTVDAARRRTSSERSPPAFRSSPTEARAWPSATLLRHSCVSRGAGMSLGR